MTLRSVVSCAIGCAALFAAGAALAQKSKDTVRVGLLDPIRVVDGIFDPKQETSFVTGSVFDNTIRYDDRAGQFKPLMAKSFKRVSDTVVEMEMRDDMRWHDGEKVTADDVVALYDWILDPKTTLRNKDNHTWLQSVEKTGTNSVRYTAKAINTMDLWQIANTDIYPKHIHAKLENRETFGQKPVGSGPYRVTEFDRNKGVTLERWDDYKAVGDWHKASNVKRFQAFGIPDSQTRVAQLKVGGVDLIQGLEKDQTDDLSTDPNLAVTSNQNLLVVYMLMDAKGRSGVPALTNVKVRRAIEMAIDRKALAKALIAGADGSGTHDFMCDPRMFGCEGTKKVPAYDPAGAKKLMAEAGYANGFEMTLTATPRVRSVAEGISGYLHEIGIKASVQSVPSVAYRKLQEDGKINVLLHTFSFLGMADVGIMMSFYYDDGPRDMAGDDVMFKLRYAGENTMDPARRKATYREALDRINENAYNMVVSAYPATFVHSKDVRVETGSMSPYGAILEDIYWK
jgi:peptide/nickel transport system substrate-binding protein